VTRRCGESPHSSARSSPNRRPVLNAQSRNGYHSGWCAFDEGVLFRTNEDGFVKTKRKLTDECDLWCVLSLPGGVFSTAGAGVKTKLLFFTKGTPTERIWYYDLSDVKVGKKSPLTLKHFEDFAAKLATRADSDRSWTVDLAARRAKATEEALPFRETHAARRAKRTGLGTYWQYSRKQSRGMMLQLVRPRFASS